MRKGSNIMKDALNQQLEHRTDPVNNAALEYAVIILKPGQKQEYIDATEDFLNKNGLRIVFKKHHQLNRDQVFAIYNDIFRFSEGDSSFGIGWKQRKLDYMLSSGSIIYLVQGIYAQKSCESFKYILRDKYGKVSVPNRTLSDQEFEELAIKNIIHVVDESETEVALWLFKDLVEW